MAKVELGRVHVDFPFYLDNKGRMYLKIFNISTYIYQPFKWVQAGTAVQIINHVTNQMYTEDEVREFIIDDNHHLSTDPFYQEMKHIPPKEEWL